MKRRFWALAFLAAMTLHGCGGTQPDPEPLRVVTQIQVTGSQNGQIFQKTFTDMEKMEAVLHCIRRLDPGKACEITPDSFRTDAYEIVVSYSDGDRTVYRQLYHQYLQIDSQHYREIKEGPAFQLAQLLNQLPGDHGLYS